MNSRDYNPDLPKVKGAIPPAPRAAAKPPFAGIGAASTESSMAPLGLAFTVELPASSRGLEGGMVAAMEGRRTARKHNAGRILLAIGGAALFLQLWALWLEAGEAWSRAAAESLGWIGALGMAALQMMNFIAWNPNGILLSLTRVLLLCWPVAVMIAGVAVSRRSC